MRPLHCASLLCAAAAATTTARAQNLYVLDDGEPDAGIAYGFAADYGWLQAFSVAGEDAITKVRIMFQPGAIPAGTRIEVCVWDDPDDDGNPGDAVLAARSTSIVPARRELAWTDYVLPDAAGVRGVFFLGAYLTTDGCSAALGLVDTDVPIEGRAWYAVAAPGQFDPGAMARNNPARIETLGSGLRGVYMLRGEGLATTPAIYCAATSDPQGCRPRIAWLGLPSASAGAGFYVQASGILNRTPTTLLYSLHGRAAAPFAGGTLCVAPPLRRVPAHSSGGTATAVDCSGAASCDFAAWIASGADPGLAAGTTVTAQWYTRDPAFLGPRNIALSDAIEFVLAP